MYRGEGSAYDFALGELASAAPAGITPMYLNESPLGSGDLGRAVRHVGFSVTDDSTNEGGG